MNYRCPRLVAPDDGGPLIWEEGAFIAEDGTRYQIVDGIPRFVSDDNYARAFGEQWVRFPRTQLDSATGIPLSASRLARCLRADLACLQGQLVLEAGSGAGRFTEVLLAHGATVDSFDYSGAVAANATNNGKNSGLSIVQADIRRMPFPEAVYDLVVCLGVVQHTPDPEETLRALWSRVRPGGRLVFDHYRRKIRNYLPPPLGVAGMAYRWYFLRVPKGRQFEAVKHVVDFWFPLVWRFRKSRWIQFVLSRLNPIVNYYPHFGLRDREMYYEWMLLDTHDAMTDVYKHRRTAAEIRRFLVSLGAEEIEVSHGGNGVEASCRKPT
ncbi:class I SAM-dependent methyltransferase [Luteimonas suaedae]|uniref:class I SAM-dependent methyltransferase n=1 Tax=Luteimonas suaedae TaxID=2605430 RepID=UPI0016598227|nr:class I SAM-dependent methyltransferase [Luteimonas suaedae]